MEDKTRGKMPMDNITKILGNDKLPPEIVNTLQEAFDKKVEEVREQTEMSMREEFSRRYDHDKNILVESIDRMLTDVVAKHTAEKVEAVKKMNETRNNYKKAIKESRKNFKTKLDEQSVVARAAVSSKLKEEVQKLREAKQAITQERMNYADKLSAVKESLAVDYAKRIKKIDEFVVRNIEKELKEFLVDHKALVVTRAKLVSESRKKLKETQSRFVKEAAKKVERKINETLGREMTQLHEDLEKNRQNMFGRKIFEAVAAEFMSSYLAEGTEIRKLQNVLESKETELLVAKGKLTEAQKESQIFSRKVKLAEDKASRTKIMSELLSNLRGEKRQVMEGMLETVRTEALRESFNKLLPVVIDETVRSNSKPTTKTALQGERNRTQSTVVTGGNRSSSRLAEAIEMEVDSIDPDLAQVIRLAGLTR